MKFLLLAVCVLFVTKTGAAPPEPQKGPEKIPTIAVKTSEMKAFPGFFSFYWDEKEGHIWLEIQSLDTEFLYVSSLAAGMGSNDIGLDRGQLGREHIVKFVRSGPKVLLLEPNYRYRATTDNPDERRAVEEAFAQSVLWGFTVGAEEGNRVLVDATAFFLRDAHGVIGSLKRSRQGTFRLDASRCAFFLEQTKNFPDNTETDVRLTFTGDEPGGWIRSVTPTPEAVTVRQHHSLIRLPDNQFVPRRYDPRAGFFGMSYMDYAAPIGEPITKRFLARHRLIKKDPTAAVSEPVKPIVYYVDRGAPEPIRSALIDGARWWNQAFEAAGYKDAFRVEVLPEGVDPMDVRYNVIQWVHRSTRGWSYGRSVMDPRTGEILKGHVSLGSLRVRQDYLIAEGLLAPYEEGKPVPAAMKNMALARLRQLAAHEVGHTLGLSHNYIASTADRASVMDYPHPLIAIDKNNDLDLSHAYAVGIGEWDKVAITYGYGEFGKGEEEAAALESTLKNAMDRGLIFLSDQDARPQGSSHPLVHLWDNGTNAINELNHILKVRSIALSRFSERNIRKDMPMATLEEALVPVYLLHRYQVEAAAKVLGGLSYTYAMRGDGQVVTAPVAAKEQRRALQVLLNTLTPGTLRVPEKVLSLLPPRPMGYSRHRELFPSRTGLTFDALSPAEVASNHVLTLLLHPERAARLVEHHARDNGQPGLAEVLDALLNRTWKSKQTRGYDGEIQRVVDNVALSHLFSLATAQNAPAQVRAVTTVKLMELKDWMTAQAKRTKDMEQRAHLLFAVQLIGRFQEDPAEFVIPRPAEPPPGQPIGEDDFIDVW